MEVILLYDRVRVSKGRRSGLFCACRCQSEERQARPAQQGYKDLIRLITRTRRLGSVLRKLSMRLVFKVCYTGVNFARGISCDARLYKVDDFLPRARWKVITRNAIVLIKWIGPLMGGVPSRLARPRKLKITLRPTREVPRGRKHQHGLVMIRVSGGGRHIVPCDATECQGDCFNSSSKAALWLEGRHFVLCVCSSFVCFCFGARLPRN